MVNNNGFAKTICSTYLTIAHDCATTEHPCVVIDVGHCVREVQLLRPGFVIITDMIDPFLFHDSCFYSELKSANTVVLPDKGDSGLDRS